MAAAGALGGAETAAPPPAPCPERGERDGLAPFARWVTAARGPRRFPRRRGYCEALGRLDPRPRPSDEAPDPRDE